MKSAVRFWINTSLNSAMVAENISVSISVAKRGPVQDPILTILGPITVKVALTISFSAEDVANTGREEAVFL